jgi:hypothetical protein
MLIYFNSILLNDIIEKKITKKIYTITIIYIYTMNT